MKISKIGAPQVIMSNPMSKHSYFAWPSVVRLQNGRIAAGASGFRLTHVCPFGKAVLSFSENEGETYSAPAPIIDTPLDDRDVGLTVFGKSGLIFTSFNNTIEFQREKTDNYSQNPKESDYRISYLDFIASEDEKKYLGSTFRISHDCGTTFGELHHSPITSPHGPIELNDGTVLWVGRTFAQEKDRIEAHIMDTESGEMTLIGSISQIDYEGEKLLSCEPYALQMPNGDILCHIRAQRRAAPGKEKVFTTYQSVSKDNGKTWSDPIPLLDAKGGAPSHLLLHSSGVLIAAYGYREPTYGIHIMLSKDYGETWETDHILYENTISDDLGYPATVELNDHSLATVFYARHDDDKTAVILQQKWRLENE